MSEQVPNWAALVAGGLGTAGVTKLIHAIRDYRSAGRKEDRQDFVQVTAQYQTIVTRLDRELQTHQTLVTRLDRELEALRGEVTDLKGKHAECMAQNARMEVENANLREDLAALRQRVDLLPKPRQKAK